MSFGFSIGDFIAVFEQAKQLRKDFQTAPAQYQAIAVEVKNFSVLIEGVNTCFTGHTPSQAQQKELLDIARACKQTLSEAEDLLRKYSSLESVRATSFKERTKRVWQRVKLESNDIRDFRNRITANISLLTAYANSFQQKSLANLISKHDSLAHTVLQRQREQERQYVLDWLAPLDYIAQHSSHASHRLADTCQWLLDSPEYVWWSSKDSESKALYLHGIPGAGKSILSSLIIDDIQAKYALANDIGVCYYYCDYNRQEKFEQILLCILRQLANPIGLAIVENLYGDYSLLGVRPTLSAIKDALYATVEQLSLAFIVVDALDECQSTDGCQKNLLKELSELNKLPNVNIAMTSRHRYDATLSFRNLKSMEVLASSQDIGRYIETHIQLLPNFVIKQSDLQEEIKAAIINAVGGVFLLATLHFQALQGKRSARQLRLTLNSLGSLTYLEAYTSTMTRICSQVEDQKALAIDTLMWVIYARRSLTTAELLHALAVEIDAPEFYKDDVPDIMDVLSTCCGLIVVEPETQLVRLVHRTTQEFLKEYGSTWLPRAHTKISKICNTYLAFKDLIQEHNKESVPDLLVKFPLWDYASRHYLDHAKLREDLSIEELVTSQKQIDKSSRILMTNTASDYLDLHDRHPDLAGLHLLAYCGRIDMMPKFLETYDVNEVDRLTRTPISCAVQKDQLEAAKMLIENGARLDDRYENTNGILKLSSSAGDTLILHALDLNRRAMALTFIEAGAKLDVNTTHLGREQLFKAIKNKDIDGIQLLIENGVEIDHPNLDGWTPICFACKEGDDKIVQFLLDNGANVGIHTKGDESPVEIAFQSSNLEIAEILLEKGYSSNNERFDIADKLSRAAYHGRIEIIKLLLGKGIENGINLTCDDLQPPLIAASGKGHVETIQLLLDRGVDINKANKYGETALNLASRKGHVETVRLLLDRGADINKATKYGETALHEASGKGHVEIVRLLLARGADINKANGYGETALHKASQEGHVETVQLLKAGCRYASKDSLMAASKGFVPARQTTSVHY